MKFLFYIFIVLSLFSCKKNDDYVPITEPTSPTLIELNIPSNLPELTYDLSSNQPTEEGFELGKKLFFEGDLSSDGIVSCGFCHSHTFAFTHSDHVVSHGVNGVFGTRNAQPIQNMIFMKEFGWDGSVTHLDAFSIVPLTTEFEMDETVGNVINKLKADEEYVNLFADAFEDDEINPTNLFKALSQFMTVALSVNSKYDKVMRNEGNISFSTDEQEGFDIFNNKCASCHSGSLQTNQEYKNNGLSLNTEFNDIGRERATGLSSDRYKFKVPSLRNIEVTSHYMHDGRFSTLEEVLDHYTDGVVNLGTLSSELIKPDSSFGIDLTSDEKQKLILFLKTLTDTDFLNDNKFDEF